MITAAPDTVDLVSIDVDNLGDVEDIPEAILFDIRLSAEPSAAWTQEFRTAYATLHHPIKPPVEIEPTRLRIAYLPRYSGELADYIAFLKSAVDRANAEIRRSSSLAERGDEGRKTAFRSLLRQIRL
ncbi:MAG: hypothetical protein ACLQVD_17580 [Capsulimonadaceae bacterium]